MVELTAKSSREKIKILDIGTSHFTILLKNIGYNVSTIDINTNWKCRTKQEGITLKRCDLRCDRIPFSDNMFYVVIEKERKRNLIYKLW